MTTSLLTFALAGSDYAIPLGRVREVVICRAIARVPNANESLRGVMNLRGSIIPVLDLACRLGLGRTTVGDATCAVLLETEADGETTFIAGLVDEIRSVVDFEPEAIAAAPDFGTPVDARLVRAVATEKGRYAYVLDLDEVLAGIS